MDAAPSINRTRQTAGGSFPLEAGLRSISTVVLALCVTSGLAVAGDAAEQQDFRLSVDVRRVVLTVTVESDDNQFIGGLTKDDFVVFDNGKPQKLIAFKHDSMLGNAPAHKLFERVVVPKIGIARSFDDYKTKITVDRENLPPEVKLLELL